MQKREMEEAKSMSQQQQQQQQQQQLMLQQQHQQQQQLLLLQQLQKQQHQQSAISRFPSNIDAHLRPPGLLLRPQSNQTSNSSPNPNSSSASSVPNPNPQNPQQQQSQQSQQQQSQKAIRPNNQAELQMAYQDAWRVCHPDFKRPFTSLEDACERPKSIYKDPDDGRQRFLLELEFVQCLANPTYIHYLAQNRYFEDEAFIGYLKYLQYWQRPEYTKFIMYPHCLFFLELLQNANFRAAMAHPGNKELAHREQFFFWKNYRSNRLKHILPRPLPEPVSAPPASAPSQPPVPATSISATAASAAPSALSPMQQYSIPSGSSLANNDMRSGIDRRKRKKEA